MFSGGIEKQHRAVMGLMSSLNLHNRYIQRVSKQTWINFYSQTMFLLICSILQILIINSINSIESMRRSDILWSYIFSSKILAVESCTESFGIHLVILINYSWKSLTTPIKKNTHSSLCWMSIYKLKMIYCW